MKFFLDENFPKLIVQILEDRGHQVFDIRSSKFEGSNDTDIFKMAQERGAIFVTTDKDFYHTIPYLFEKHHGIIVVALHQPNRKSLIEKLLFAIDYIDLSKLKSKALLLRDKDYSII